MELINEFEVEAEALTVWAVLADFEQVAQCIPGTALEEVIGDQYKGSVRVKVGPVNAQYRGRATYLERNRIKRRVVIKGDGHDSRGIGHASAVLAAKVVELDEKRSSVQLKSDVAITGRVAQFGRGVVNEVGAHIIAKFAANLSRAVRDEQIRRDTFALADLTPEMFEDKTRKQRSDLDLPEPESVDLLEAASAPIAKRALPVIGAGLVGFFSFRWLRRRWRSK